MKKILSVILAMTLTILSASFSVSASEAVDDSASHEGELKIISYNVAGLPIPSMFSDENRVVIKDTLKIGDLLNNESYDIIDVQEDFNFHFLLSSQIKSPYKTYTMGGIPAGSGLNLYSKRPIYNIERVKWDTMYGVFDGEQDELTPKGYLYCTLEIADGVYIDFYTVHLDAGGDENSVAAKHDNFRQLLDDINSKSEAGRAVIIAGDFNARLIRPVEGLYERLLEPAGLKDCWAEICNDGDYHPTEYRGEWREFDSLDRIVYRSGKNVELKVSDFGYKLYCDEDGRSLSDHSSAQAVIKYKYTDEAIDNDITLKTESFSLLKVVKNYIVGIFTDIKLFIGDIDTLINIIKK